MHILFFIAFKYYSVFQFLTSFCHNHIFKTLNTICTTSVCCDHTINTMCVVFTQYTVRYHVSKMLILNFPTSLPINKIMDLYSHIHKCLNTACQKWRTNVTNLKYSIKLLLPQQQQLKHIEKTRCMKYCNWWLKYFEIADFSLSWRNSPVLKLFLLH